MLYNKSRLRYLNVPPISLLILLTVFSITSGCSSNRNKEATLEFDAHADSLQLGEPESIIYLDSLVSVLGDKALLSLKERNGIFYLLDGQSKRLFAIDSEGNAKYIIDRIGRGMGEYLNIIDFEVSDKRLVYLLTGEGNEVMVFDEGVFSRKYDIGFRASSLSFLNDKDIALFKQRYEDETLGQDVIVITDTAFNVKNRFLEESSMLLTGSGEHLVPGVKNTVLCHQQYVNGLYWFNAKGITSELKLDFGEKAFPESLFEAEDFEAMFPIISESSAYYINSCFENDKYLLLNVTLSDHMNENLKYIWLYDKDSRKSFIKMIDSESPEYGSEGMPMQITNDNRLVFLYDISLARLNEPNARIASYYAIVFQKLNN